MKVENDDMPAEYDFESMGLPVRGKHLEKHRRFVRMIHLSEDLSERYPDAESVLAALRRDSGIPSKPDVER